MINGNPNPNRQARHLALLQNGIGGGLVVGTLFAVDAFKHFAGTDASRHALQLGDAPRGEYWSAPVAIRDNYPACC